MNQIKKITFLFISTILVFSACKKEEETNKTESYYKVELERIAHFKPISQNTKLQKSTNSLNFKSYKEAYDFFSVLKKGVSTTDTIKGKLFNENEMKSINLSRLSAKNQTLNWEEPIVVERSYRDQMQIISPIGGSALPGHTLACLFEYGFIIKYINFSGGTGMWHGEIFHYQHMGRPSYHFSGIGTITHNSASRWQENKNESIIDGVVKIGDAPPISFFITVRITIAPIPAPNPDGSVITSGHMIATGF